MKRNVEFATIRDILTRNAEAPTGTARRQATETVIVPTRKTKEEDPKVATEVNKNLTKDQGTSQNKEETLLTLRKTKAESPTKITGLRQKILTNLDRLTMIDQADQDQDQIMMKNHLKEERSLKESQADAATTVTAELWLHIRQDV